jgi:hypothetical protein
MESMSVPIAFISPISRRRVTISKERVVETTTTPITKTRSKIDQTKVEKNVPMDVESALAIEYAETSRRTLPKRKMKVVAAIVVLRDIRTRALLKGRRFKSFDANSWNSDIRL